MPTFVLTGLEMTAVDRYDDINLCSSCSCLVVSIAIGTRRLTVRLIPHGLGHGRRQRLHAS